MNADSGAAVQLVTWVFPMMYGWFFIGAVIAVFYHLSLYTFDGEFRLGQERALDLAVSILRGVAYFVAWPAIFCFDRSAVTRIGLYLRYLDPENRVSDPDVVEALRERDYRIWARKSFLDRTKLENRRARELRTLEQRQRRLVTLHEDSRALDRYWLLTGIGTHWMGVREMVRDYLDYQLPEEIEEGVRRELRIRHQRRCPGCGAGLVVRAVAVPGANYLRVLTAGTGRVILEGWAVRGEFGVEFEPCDQCGVLPEPVTGDLAACGRTREVVEAAKHGLTLFWEPS